MLNSVKWEILPLRTDKFYYICSMKRSRFIVVTLLVILSLAVLITIEAVWAVRTYRDLRVGYQRQIVSILDEALHQYVTPINGSKTHVNIGDAERFYAIVAEELRTSGIETPFMVEVLTTTDDDLMLLMSWGGDDLDSERLSIDNRDYAPLIMRLTVEDPHASIIESMLSILILQALSILLLIVAFVYLLVTLFRAKSIDKIRRDLTHNITHELKTPIAAAYAANDVLLTSPDVAANDELRSDYLRMTHDELERLNHLVEEILRTATEEGYCYELRIEECDIEAIVARVVKSLDMKYATRKVDWHIEISPHVTLIADSFHLEGIISALADNAIKYSLDEATVGISVSVDDNYAYVNISDKGVGIARVEQRRIFDKFYRITAGNRHDTKGYGLGLHYVRTMIRRHGGTITVTSSRGKGSTFSIKLPRYGTKRDISR